MRHFFYLLLATLASVTSTGVHAQNVTNYAAMPEPILFLLREPTVHKDLKLDERQLEQLVALNERMDGGLLSSRNKPPSQATKLVEQVMSETLAGVGQILSKEQQNRLQQIKYRVRGISFVLMPEAADRLELTADQKQRIERIVQSTLEEIKDIQTKMAEGDQTPKDANQAAKKVKSEEQQRILSALDEKQKRALVSLVGPVFDVSQLGKVTFRAPELAQAGTWINSNALKLSNLHGKVVALHFWAFG